MLSVVVTQMIYKGETERERIHTIRKGGLLFSSKDSLTRGLTQFFFLDLNMQSFLGVFLDTKRNSFPVYLCTKINSIPILGQGQPVSTRKAG